LHFSITYHAAFRPAAIRIESFFRLAGGVLIENEQDPIFDKRRPVYGKDYDRGWIGFNHTARVTTRIIASAGQYEAKSGIPVSHVFIVTGEDTCVEAEAGKGVLTNSLTSQYFEEPSRYVVFRKPRGLTPQIADRICELAEAKVGSKFDHGVFVAHAINDHFVGWILNKLTADGMRRLSDDLFNDPEKWICSELGVYVLNQFPEYEGIGSLSLRPGLVTPQELFENDEVFEPLPQPDGSFRGARETHPRIVEESVTAEE
jgi:hypothetical protein